MVASDQVEVCLLLASPNSGVGPCILDPVVRLYSVDGAEGYRQTRTADLRPVPFSAPGDCVCRLIYPVDPRIPTDIVVRAARFGHENAVGGSVGLSASANGCGHVVDGLGGVDEL